MIDTNARPMRNEAVKPLLALDDSMVVSLDLGRGNSCLCVLLLVLCACVAGCSESDFTTKENEENRHISHFGVTTREIWRPEKATPRKTKEYSTCGRPTEYQYLDREEDILDMYERTSFFPNTS